MDHILDQAPIYRPRTPSNFAHASPGMSRGESATLADRRPSTVSDVINPLTGQPGETTRSRRSSMSSSAPSPIQLEHHIESNKESGIDKQGLTPSSGVPWPRTWPRTAAPGMVLTSSSPEVHGAGRLLGDLLPASPLITSSRPRSTSQISPAEGPRQFQTAGELASRLPAHLQALRATPPSANGSASPIESSSTAPSTGPNVGLRKRSSLLGTDSCDVQGGGRGNGGDADNLATFATSGLPILVNPKCSGYFVEPVSRSLRCCMPRFNKSPISSHGWSRY